MMLFSPQSYADRDNPNDLYLDPSVDGLVLGPTGLPDPNDFYQDSAANYFNAVSDDGFDGNTMSFVTPEQFSAASYSYGQEWLTESVESYYDNGDFGSDDPLWLFGYSQSATIISLSESAWSDYGIPQDALHIVLVGDPLVPDSGFFTFYGSDPTPDVYYPTDVFTIPGDGWADYSNASLGGLNPFAVFNPQHEMYLGVSPDDIRQAIEDGPDVDISSGLTDYYSLDLGWVEQIGALLNSLWAVF